MAPAKHVATALAHAVAQVSQTWWGRERPDDERAPRGCERCGKRDGALMEIRLRGRRRRVQDSHDSLENLNDCSLVEVQTRFEFGFQCGQFAGEFTAVAEGSAHFYKGTDDKHAHLSCFRAIEHVCRHHGTVLGEGTGRKPRVTVLLRTGHKL